MERERKEEIAIEKYELSTITNIKENLLRNKREKRMIPENQQKRR